MRELLQYAAIGLGPAAVYALASAGVIAIYRGSGVVNFAYGGVALIGASVFVRTSLDLGWSIPVAIIAAVVASTATSTVVGLVISGAIRDAAPVMRVIATLGVLSVLQELNFLALGGELRVVPHFLPSGNHEIGGVTIGNERIALLAIAGLVTGAMAMLYSLTSFGRVTSAAAEDRRATESLGHSAQRVAILNWALGGALAGVTGVLVLPVSGYSPGLLTLLILPAFAAALLGRFTSFPVALLGALVLGVSQSIVVGYVDVVGVSEALPFGLIVLLLVVRSSSLPGRDELSQRLPRLASRVPSSATILSVGGVACVLVLMASGAQTAITLMIIGSIVALSQVVLVGYGGQVSLGHASLAGVAALVAGRLNQALGLPFPMAAIAGVLAAAVAGLVFGLPAIRARGVVLTIVTLGLGVSVSQLLLSNPDFTGGVQGTRTYAPSIAGIDISSERSFGLFSLLLAVSIALLVRNLRKGRVGRRLLAVRSNERAASSIGIQVTGTKLYAFIVSASIVAVAGVLLAFRTRTVDYSNFDFRHNLLAVSAALIGGVGYLAGVLIAAFNTPGGLFEYWLRDVDNLEDWLLLVGGSLLVLTLIVHPDGVADIGERVASQMRRRRSRQAEPEQFVAADEITHGIRSRGATCLEVEGLTVQFGTVRAVDDVSLVVRSGEILGVIGANGAGKTTLIDAVSGFVKTNAGTIRLDGTDVTLVKPHLRSLRGLGRSFQTVELFDELTVRDNLLVACEEASRSMWFRDFVRPGRDDLPPYALAVLDRLGLGPWIHKTPPELPQGPRALAGVARAIVTGCGILLLDEPAAGLDHQESKELGTVLRSICADLQIGILLVEHDVELVRTVSDRVIVLDFGVLIFEGSCEDAFSDAAVKDAYLGVEVGTA